MRFFVMFVTAVCVLYLISNPSTVSYKQRLGRVHVGERDGAFSLHKGKQVQSKLSPIKLHMPKHSPDDSEALIMWSLGDSQNA